MQKWEYKVLALNKYGSLYSDNEVRTKQLRGEKGFFGDEKGVYPKIWDYLNELGAIGWEVIGVSPVNTNIDGQILEVNIILKRPIED